MKYVKTFKRFIGKDVQITENVLSVELFNKLVANVIHGGKIILTNGRTYTSKLTQKNWAWELVATPPHSIYYHTYVRKRKFGNQNFYNAGKGWKQYTSENEIPANCLYTAKECYAIGQKLIARVNKANQPKGFDDPAQRRFGQIFHDVSVDFGIWLMRNGITFYSKDNKVIMEVNANLQTLAEIRNIHKPELHTAQMPEELLSFYARAFQIQIPTYYLKQTPIKTEKGFAICPSFELNNKITYSSNMNGEHKEYMGNTPEEAEARKCPYTLTRDAVPTQLNLHDKERLQEQVEYYLSLPEDIASEFLAETFKFIDHVLTEIDPPKPWEETSYDDLSYML